MTQQSANMQSFLVGKMLAVSSLEKVKAINYHPPSLVTSLLTHLPQCCGCFFLHGQCSSTYCQYNDSSHMTLAGFFRLAVAFADLHQVKSMCFTVTIMGTLREQTM